MTLRLVGLISIVLLLSLAAFGLLMGHYQDQVMQEVARTASAVGKATLRTLEDSDSSAGRPGGGTWVTKGETAAGGTSTSTIMLRRIRRTADGKVHDEVFAGDPSTLCKGADDLPAPCLPSAFECGDGVSEASCMDLQSRFEERLRDRAESTDVRVFVDVEEVRVDRQPADGLLVLHIPTLTPTQDPPAGSNAVQNVRTRATADLSALRMAHGDVIELPIAVDDYDALFKSIRGRSLFLFLGVFVVGMVLSTALAARFTKPIRRLDAGIRRLSDGDLDVRVDVQGKDEIARLGLAFNDMAHKLKEGQDRSREMVRREKLSALGGLAAGVAHDVRNPLHSIGLTLQHLRETCRPESDERAVEFDRSMDIIRGEIRRLDSLVTSFLRFSRSEPRERQTVDLADLLQETARLIQKEAEWRGIEVRMNVNSVAPAVSADGESIRASILNLVLNSFNAMPKGGRLDLSLEVEHDALVIGVADNGHGIPEDEQDRVFEFAYSTREGGSGLGLAMVHQCIVEEHGGRVSMNSTPGEGTTVRLALPIRPPERGEAS